MRSMSAEERGSENCETSGGRVGEPTALTWNDVDLAAGRLAFRRSVSWAKRLGDTTANGPTYIWSLPVTT